MTIRTRLIKLAYDRPDLRSAILPLLGVDKKASLEGTYADFVFRGEALFLQEAAKGINALSRGHGTAKLHFQGGRSPFLTYDGEDMNDIGLDVTFSISNTSSTDVTLHWWGKSEYTGRIDGRAEMKWGQLTSDRVVQEWRNVASHR